MKKRILMLTWTSRKIRGFCPFIFKNEISWIIHLGYNISHLLCFRSVKKVIISQVTSTSFFLWFYYRNWTVDVVLHLQKRKHVLRFGNLIGFSVSSKIYKRIYHTIHSVGNISHCSMQYSFCYWNNWKIKTALMLKFELTQAIGRYLNHKLRFNVLGCRRRGSTVFIPFLWGGNGSITFKSAVWAYQGI